MCGNKVSINVLSVFFRASLLVLIWWLLYLYFGAWTGWLAFAYSLLSVASIVVFSRNRNT